MILPSAENLLSFFVLTILTAMGQFSTRNLSDFIISYTSNSEYQFSFYTLILCGGKERQLLPALSAAFKNLYWVRPLSQYNISEWNVSPDHQGFILDMECEHARDILRQGHEHNLFRKPYSWLLLTNMEKTANNYNISEEDTQVDDMFGLRDLNVRLDSLVVIATVIDPYSVNFTEVYKIREHMELIVLPMGHWIEGEGITLYSHEVIVWRRRDLQGISIPGTIVINHNDSWNHMDDMVNKHLDTASRRCHTVIPTLTSVFNASMHYLQTDSWGSYVNGSWGGMVQHLVTEQAEVGHTFLFITHDRLDVIEYLIGDFNIRLAFIATAPPLSYSSNLFTLPFSRSVWLSSVLLVVVTSIILYVTAKHENKNITHTDKETLGANWSDIAMLNLGAICQQGCDAEPRGTSGRIVTILLYFSVMFLYVSYSASIVALLQSSDTSIKTTKDLLESPLQCGAEDIPYQRVWFKAASDPVGRQLYLKKMAPKGEENANFMSIEEGIKKVREGLYAFHVELSPGYNVVQKTFTEAEKCGLQELPSFLTQAEPWLPMRKNSPFGEVFKVGIKMMREVGIESRVVRRLSTKKPPCSAPGSKFVSVGLVDCYHLFLILSYGIIASVILAVVEKLVSLRLQRRLQEVNKTWFKKAIRSNELEVAK